MELTLNIKTKELENIIAQNSHNFGDPFMAIYASENGDLECLEIPDDKFKFKVLSLNVLALHNIKDDQGLLPKNKGYNSQEVAKRIIKESLLRQVGETPGGEFYFFNYVK